MVYVVVAVACTRVYMWCREWVKSGMGVMRFLLIRARERNQHKFMIISLSPPPPSLDNSSKKIVLSRDPSSRTPNSKIPPS